MSMTQFGKLIQSTREKKSLTQQQLARKADVSQSLVSKLENGRMQAVDLIIGVRIIRSLRLNLVKTLGMLAQA